MIGTRNWKDQNMFRRMCRSKDLVQGHNNSQKYSCNRKGNIHMNNIHYQPEGHLCKGMYLDKYLQIPLTVRISLYRYHYMEQLK